MKLDKWDIAIVNAANKNDVSRPVLQTVCLKNGKLAAADGFMLVVRDAAMEPGESKDQQLLPAQCWRNIKTDGKKIAQLSAKDGEATISYKNDKGKPIEYDPQYSFKLMENATFPNYPQLFPESTEKKAQIAVNVGKLKKLLSCMPDTGILRIGITEPSAPMEVECVADRPIRGLLMPMYVEWDKFRWYRAPKPDCEGGTSDD